ncbi:hypothetical protein MLX39_24960 [Escherichia coli]|nr:hypothetical protein [Shigella sonnei]MCI3481274.1 hypothetical protein [Escherichia coli]MCI3695351.1 hypothetical protein [Escherichia coli]MCN2619759.1 hypothetical protein [Escherichia coli]MCN3397730.1 hypothetical protein [Escherichia coli]MCN3738868.1 hypothetical protein [Escherichia coli]
MLSVFIAVGMSVAGF